MTENQVFAYRMTSGGFFESYDERWEIEETPSSCRFSFDDHIEFPYGSHWEGSGGLPRGTQGRQVVTHWRI